MILKIQGQVWKGFQVTHAKLENNVSQLKVKAVNMIEDNDDIWYIFLGGGCFGHK